MKVTFIIFIVSALFTASGRRRSDLQEIELSNSSMETYNVFENYQNKKRAMSDSTAARSTRPPSRVSDALQVTKPDSNSDGALKVKNQDVNYFLSNMDAQNSSQLIAAYGSRNKSTNGKENMKNKVASPLGIKIFNPLGATDSNYESATPVDNTTLRVYQQDDNTTNTLRSHKTNSAIKSGEALGISKLGMIAKFRLGKYEVLDEIGEGSFGKVFLVRCADDNDTTTLKIYAMKEFKIYRKGKKIRTSRALEEATILSKLEHENIIKHVDVFISDGLFYLVLEYAREGDLSEHLEKQKEEGKTWKKSCIIKMFSQIVDGLAYLHNDRIIHRDVKPGNILVAENFILKIADFGLARQMEASEIYANTQCGTKVYMAPEVVWQDQYSFSADVWALGCILYELCTLERAFDHVRHILAAGIPCIPHDIDGENFQGLSTICTRLLHRDANKRVSCEALNKVFQQKIAHDSSSTQAENKTAKPRFSSESFSSDENRVHLEKPRSDRTMFLSRGSSGSGHDENTSAFLNKSPIPKLSLSLDLDLLPEFENSGLDDTFLPNSTASDRAQHVVPGSKKTRAQLPEDSRTLTLDTPLLDLHSRIESYSQSFQENIANKKGTNRCMTYAVCCSVIIAIVIAVLLVVVFPPIHSSSRPPTNTTDPCDTDVIISQGFQPFPCEVINGNLIITQVAGIANGHFNSENFIPGLTRIEGGISLHIGANLASITFPHLEFLTQMGTIEGMESLEYVSFPKLQRIAVGELLFRDNPVLSRIEFDELQQMFGVRLILRGDGNVRLTFVNFPKLDSASAVIVTGAPALSIISFPELDIAAEINIASNPVLTRFFAPDLRVISIPFILVLQKQ